jgi:hypothetical protein
VIGGLAAATLVGWLLVFAKTGSRLDLSAHDYVARAAELPSLLVTGDPLVDYRNWSVLPLVLGRLLAARTTAAFASVQFVVMLAGSAAVIAWTAARRPRVALAALLALFSTTVPSYAMFFMGSYDQLLLVALVGIAVGDRRRAAVLFGMIIGLTHGELGVIAVAGLVALSAVGVGPSMRVRLWGLGGVVGARLALTVWFAAAGQPSDRFSYIEAYGLERMIDYFGATWPVILLTVAGGGWVIIAAALAERRSSRVALVVAGVIVVNLAVSAITIDQSRVAMLTSLPLVVTLAAFPPSRRAARPPWAVAAPFVAAAIGLLLPFWISWVGDTWRFGDPFDLAW